MFFLEKHPIDKSIPKYVLCLTALAICMDIADNSLSFNVPVVQSGTLVPLGQKLQPSNSVQAAAGGHTVLAQSGMVPSR